MIIILVMIKPVDFQRFPDPSVVSSHDAMAPIRLNRAKDLIPPNQTAPPGLVPLHGISLSTPMRAPSEVARRKLQNNDCSIEK